MSENNNNNAEEPSLRDLLKVLWRQKRIISITLAFLFTLAFIYLHTATPMYSVNLKVYPVEANNSSISGKLTGLAALAGANIGNNEGDKFELFLVGIYNYDTAIKLAKDQDLMHFVFRNEWDADKNMWVEPVGAITNIVAMIKKLLGFKVEDWEPPTPLRLQAFIKNRIVITKNRDNSVVILSINTTAPEFGAKLLQSVHKVIDTTLRERDLIASNYNIAYLVKKLEQVKVREYRQALIEVLSSQEKRRMLATSGENYAAQPFDRAIPSLEPVSPSPILTLFLTLFIGLFFGIVVGMVKDYSEIEK